MESIRKGLRQGELVKDTYERLTCDRCEKPLKTENDPEELHTVRICPECGRRWKQIQ
jgi:RNase P subunit RPR2